MHIRTALLLLALACNGKDVVDTDGDTVTTDGVNDDGTTSPTHELVESNCIDGDYRETLPDVEADMSAELSAFSSADPAAFLIAALEKRYPPGAVLVEGGLQSDAFGNVDCIEAFTSAAQRGSTDGMLESASTLVHECGHFYDIELGQFRNSVYVITEDLTLTCSGGGMNVTPARSLINGDAWAAMRPNDTYKRIYLDGNPSDGSFDSGDQGLDTVIEESVQYINSLATDWAFRGVRGSNASVSARDGILTFLWYIERYLAYMRVNTPNVYETVLDTPCWREAILTVWGRAWLYLDATEGVSGLGIDDAEIMELVRTPELLEEIQRVRDAEGC